MDFRPIKEKPKKVREKSKKVSVEAKKVSVEAKKVSMEFGSALTFFRLGSPGRKPTITPDGLHLVETT